MSLSDWNIAIPSYKRQDQIVDKRLSTLKHYTIPPSKITIFVADKEEEKLYKEAIHKGAVNDRVIGVLGMDKIRNFIADYYPKGKHIVMIDDDIRGFNQKAGINNVKPLDSLIRLIEKGFKIATEEKCSLWGIYPVNNGLFMKDTITTDLRFIMGSFWGIINPMAYKDPRGIIIPMPGKEDYTRTLLAYERDGKVIRFNYVAAVSTIYNPQGGLGVVSNRLKRDKLGVQYLLKKYPDKVRLRETENSMFPEVSLNRHV